jgi:hypothetical protein
MTPLRVLPGGRPGWQTADCGLCGLTPPDEFGNRDLIEQAGCPEHSPAPRPVRLVTDEAAAVVSLYGVRARRGRVGNVAAWVPPAGGDAA